MTNFTITNEEVKAYRSILKKSAITLQDIVFLAWKHVIDKNRSDAFDNYDSLIKSSDQEKVSFVKNEYNEFSKKFNKIRVLFGIDNCIFVREGKNNSYAFTFREATFIRELYLRIKSNPIWNQIINIKNQDQLGFVNFYFKTKEQKNFFEELSFFIEGLYNLISREQYQTTNHIWFRYHITAITKYPYLQMLQLADQIHMPSVDDLLKDGPGIYHLYVNYLNKLHPRIQKIISDANLMYEIDYFEIKHNEKPLMITETIIDEATEKKLRIEADQKAQMVEKCDRALTELVNALKKIDPEMYAELNLQNREYYSEILQKDADRFIEIYFKRNPKKPTQKNIKHKNAFIENILREDYQTAFKLISSEDRETIDNFYSNSFFFI